MLHRSTPTPKHYTYNSFLFPLEIGTENSALASLGVFAAPRVANPRKGRLRQRWILATFSIIFNLSRNLVNLNNLASSRSRSPIVVGHQVSHQNQAN